MIKYRIQIIGVLILLVSSVNLFSQSENSLQKAEAELNSYFTRLLNLPEGIREQTADTLMSKLSVTLEADESFEYAFDSIKKMGKIYSPDHKIRIYSFNVPIGIDINLYYCIVQYYSKRDKKYYLEKLKGNGIANGPISAKSWPGALYYEIVETKHAGQKYYTLLGFDLGGILTNKKVIDVIAIDDFNGFYFCHSLINYNNRLVDRVVFEYNEHVNMTLRYNPLVDMIVFDHLSPEKPSLEGNYAYYGPDLSYDGLKFEKGIWVQYKNLNITN